MPTSSTRIACALFALAFAQPADADKKPKVAGQPEPVIVHATAIKWGEAPPDLPKGAQIAVLQGDPSKSGPFTLRFKFPSGYKIAPHWHAQDEQLTILAGTFVLRMGDTMKSPTHELGVGDFHFLPSKMNHAAEAKGETVVQVHGTGPFDIHYVNPTDKPNLPKSAQK